MIRTHKTNTLHAKHTNQPITLTSWINTQHNHNKITFIDLHNTSNMVQIILQKTNITHNLRNK